MEPQSDYVFICGKKKNEKKKKKEEEHSPCTGWNIYFTKIYLLCKFQPYLTLTGSGSDNFPFNLSVPAKNDQLPGSFLTHRCADLEFI